MVDRNSEPGGLLRRFTYGEWGDFDYGMHNMLETGVADLDALLFGLLPEEEWQVLEGVHRDLAGLYINGRLQRNTPYIDLRSLHMRDCEQALAGLFDHWNRCTERVAHAHPGQTAAVYASSRFGDVAASKTVVPAVEKIFGLPASRLDVMAMTLTPMNRLAFCDEPLVGELTRSDFLRDRVAWSDQRTLPLDRASGRRAYYPAAYGIHRVVDAIVERLVRAGVQLVTSAEVAEVAVRGGAVSNVTIRSGGTMSIIEDVERLIWTSGIPGLAARLGFTTQDRGDAALKTVVVNLVVDRVPDKMGDLYYFFCYDQAFRAFRLTHFSNYCRGAGRNGGYPLSLELLIDPRETPQIDTVALGVAEFHRFDLSSEPARVLFARAEPLDAGFPMLSLANVAAVRKAREWIRGMAIGNVTLVGVLAEDNLFFQTDVLADAFTKLH